MTKWHNIIVSWIILPAALLRWRSIKRVNCKLWIPYCIVWCSLTTDIQIFYFVIRCLSLTQCGSLLRIRRTIHSESMCRRIITQTFWRYTRADIVTDNSIRHCAAYGKCYIGCLWIVLRLCRIRMCNFQSCNYCSNDRQNYFGL